MRIYLTGASGFVGSNLAHVFAREHGAEVVAPGHEHVELTDELVVRRSVLATRPDAIVHAAIWNDPAGLRSDRRRAWEAYVGATRNVVAAANAVDAQLVLISTDWVFDGTQGPGDRVRAAQPDQHLRLPQGLLGADRHRERARAGRSRGSPACRASTGRGRRRRAPRTPASVTSSPSLVDALRAGERFAVWDGPGINRAGDADARHRRRELVWRALEGEVTGVLHCCGGEHVDRVGLARRAIEVFELEPDLLDVVTLAGRVVARAASRVDTRLDAGAHRARRSGSSCPSLDAMLRAAPGRGRVIMERGMSRLTVAQALVRFLAVQETERDGRRERLFAGCFGHLRPRQRRRAGPGAAPVRATCCRYLPGAQRAGDGPHRRRLRAAAQPARRRSRAPPRSGRARRTWSPARRWRRSTGCRCCCCPGDTFATRTPHPVLQQLEAPHDATRVGQRLLPAGVALLRAHRAARAARSPRRSRRCAC